MILLLCTWSTKNSAAYLVPIQTSMMKLFWKIFNSFYPLKKHSQVWDNVWQLKALWKLWKMLFLHLKSTFGYQDICIFVLNICSCIKAYDYKDKFIFKIYNVATWETNNYNTPIAQYLKKWRQPDSWIWSFTGIFSWKIIHKMFWRNYTRTLF